MPETVITITRSSAETESLAASWAAKLAPGDVVLVSGDLGAGKTAFVRGACRGLGISEPVTSPTFTIAQRYDSGSFPVSHVDLYRLGEVGSNSAHDVALLDAEVGPDRITFIEWPEYGAFDLPQRVMRVRLTHRTETEREVSLEPGP